MRLERRETCPTGMRLLLLGCALLLTGALTTGSGAAPQLQQQEQYPYQVKIVKGIVVPAIVDPRLETLELRCDYDLAGGDLYSVNWYKNDEPLFRYMPSLERRMVVFKEAGVNVSLALSDANRITLLGGQDVHKNKAAYEGKYICEVSTEAPFFTDYDYVNVTAGILPTSNPVLDGVAPNYQVGEALEATCTSAPSLPAAELSFYLNGRKVDGQYTQRGKRRHTIGEALVASEASVTLDLRREHFKGGSLKLACRASYPEIEHREYLTEKTATLAANNQPLAQEPPRSSSSSGARGVSASYGLLLLLMLMPLLLLQLAPMPRGSPALPGHCSSFLD